MTESLPPPVWVATPEALQRLVRDLARQPRIAVDTESNSLHAYRERVCLIQFSTPGADYLVDPLALADLSSLAPLFADPRIEKIFHAAEYDLICLRRDFGFTFANLFDTMLAARTLGYKSLGLGDLLAERFGVIPDKRHQRADWGWRPLSSGLLRYAQQDTHYLLPVRDQLQAELEAKGRWLLAGEDFALACHVNEQAEKPNCTPWERIDSQRELSPRRLTILHELCLCREWLAQGVDRPVFKIVSNGTLLVLAGAVPRAESDLLRLGLTPRQIERFGADLLAAVRRGLEAAILRRSVSERPDDTFLARLEALRAWRKRAARDMGVESDVILPRRFLHAIAERGPRDEKELAAIIGQSPWRLVHFGSQILEVLKR